MLIIRAQNLKLLIIEHLKFVMKCVLVHCFLSIFSFGSEKYFTTLEEFCVLYSLTNSGFVSWFSTLVAMLLNTSKQSQGHVWTLVLNANL